MQNFAIETPNVIAKNGPKISHIDINASERLAPLRKSAFQGGGTIRTFAMKLTAYQYSLFWIFEEPATFNTLAYSPAFETFN